MLAPHCKCVLLLNCQREISLPQLRGAVSLSPISCKQGAGLYAPNLFRSKWKECKAFIQNRFLQSLYCVSGKELEQLNFLWLCEYCINFRWTAKNLEKIYIYIYIYIFFIFFYTIGYYKILNIVPYISLSWRRAWQPTPVFLLEESHEQKPGRLQPVVLQIVRHNWSNWAHMHSGSLLVNYYVATKEIVEMLWSTHFCQWEISFLFFCF